jgi:arabinogalactan endo-1,4-beta-galactosidase
MKTYWYASKSKCREGIQLLIALLLGVMVFSVQAEVVFQDDFSEADGTAINGKSPDIGSGNWWSETSANQVSGNSFTQVDSSSVSFTRAPTAGEAVTVTIVAGADSVFTHGGWTGVTLKPWESWNSVAVGDSGSNSQWVETSGGSSTGDSSAPNTVTLIYVYDTGDWTLETTALPGHASGTAAAGLDLREMSFWDDGAGGSSIEYESITVEIDTYVPPAPYVPTNGYVAWAVSNNLTTGRYGDQDGDGLKNLYEYGTDGNPTNPADIGFEPVYSIVEEGGSNWLYYTYPMNVAASNDAEYALGLTSNLLSNNWTSTGYEVLGTGLNAFAVGFNAVSNRISTAAEQSRFVRLEIVSANPDEWRGADVSMVPRFEELAGQYEVGGQTNDPIQIMMDYGMNTFRVRLFVNPDGSDTAVIQDLAYVTSFGQRIKNAGAKFLLDIHYSDTWADPGNQYKPAAWVGLSFNELEAQVEAYSSNVIATLKAAGCLPDMVQTGNEIKPGFIWPDGGPYQPDGSWSKFTTLLKAAVRGVKQPLEPGDDMKVMIHYGSGGDTGGVRSYYDQLAAYGVEYDIIGLSYYPWWHGPLSDLESTLSDAAIRFGKEIVVTEVAYPWRSTYGAMEWPQTPEGQKQFIEDVVQAVRATPNGLGKGVLWWYPEAVDDVPIHVWMGGANGLFGIDWNALPALEEF